MRVVRERSSRKEPLRDADVRALLRRVRSVIVAKGKKVTRLSAAEAGLRDLKGPTGNYRAPMILRGDVLLVGFNAEALDEVL
jgi:hypothetical protein